jgi:hypothetical protein
MKKHLLSGLAIAFALTFTSCKKEENSTNTSGVEEIANSQNSTEKFKIETATLEKGISVENATSKEGNPPQWNDENFDFNLDKTKTSGFQDTGLRIDFSSSEEITGAYIRFKDSDGNAAKNYFDVQISAEDNSEEDYKTKSSKKSNTLFKAKSTKTEDTQTIEVNFSSDIPAGTFCYEICIYDENGNISAPQEVCVTVEAWGGNAKLVDNWKENSSNTYCEYTDTISCYDGNSFTYTDNDCWDNLEVTFNSDGTYVAEWKDEYFDIDYETSATNCEITYEKTATKEHGQEKGKWAFDEENSTLFIIAFEYKDFIDSEYSEVYLDGEYGWESNIKIEGDKFSISDEELDEYYTFERK